MTNSFPKTMFVQLRKGQLEKILFHSVAPVPSPTWLMVTDGMYSLRKPSMKMCTCQNNNEYLEPVIKLSSFVTTRSWCLRTDTSVSAIATLGVIMYIQPIQ